MVLTAVGFSAQALACSSIEVKRDSPQASVTTLVKIYSAKKYELLPQVADPMAVRREKRRTACVGVVLQENACVRAMMESFAKRDYDSAAKPCPNVEDCTCGTGGDRAASNAGAFTASESHTALEVAGLDPQRCTITDAKELNGDARDKAMPSWKQYACKDIPGDARFSLVSVTCGKDAPVGLIVRQTADGWRFYQLEARSEMDLLAAASVKK